MDTAPPEPKIDPAYIEKNLLAAPPAQMTNTVNADLGGKVVYLGNDLDSDTVAPGDEVTVIHYWKVVEPPGEKWRVFTHLQGSNKQDWANIDRSDMRVGHGPGKWKAGEIIRDEHEFRVPKGWKSTHADVLVGLFPRGGHTVEDRMPIVSGPADDERRVEAVRLTLRGKGRARPRAPRAHVIPKTAEPITIDGRADEAGWKRAKESPAFTDAEGSPAVAGQTRARMLWDDQNLYVFVSVEDADVYSQYTKQDEPMWREDVIELFIDADRNRRGYVELQVNPNNAHFDAWFATTRTGPSDPAWTAGMKSAVTVHGTANERDDEDTGWDVEIAIPLAAVKGKDAAMKVSVPPRVGDTWRLNVVRVDKPEDAENPSVASWNPITYQDFHALGRMLEVVFADAAGKAEPAPAATGEAGEAAQEPAPGTATKPAPGTATPAPGTAAPAQAGEAKPGQQAEPGN